MNTVIADTHALFNIAQTFLVDAALVDQQSSVQISSVDLYFMFKPAATGNRSGTNYPGVTVYLAETIFGVPKITANTHNQFARAEWTSIRTSSDASAKTTFRFANPVSIVPGRSYAVLVSYDANETFYPWTAQNGSWLVGTRNIYNGPTGNLVGNYYEFTDNNDITNNPVGAQTEAQYLSFWTPLHGVNLKFSVNVSRYFLQGVPVSTANNLPSGTVINPGIPNQTWNANTLQLNYSFPSVCTEAISFNISASQVQAFIGAQRVYQNTVPYPGGFVNNATHVSVSCATGNNIVVANTNLPNGVLFNWNTVFNNYTGTKYIVLQDPSGNDIRKVVNIVSNTTIQIDEPPTFTNALSAFFVSPVATIDTILPTSPYGKALSLMFLNFSNANSTVRFVNNSILSITANNGGTTYSNNDVLYIKGFQSISGKEIGGYVAVANIATNSSGGITTIYMSNLGCGFVNATNIVAVVANSTQIGNTGSNSSAGTGATFNYTVGATLITELSNNIFQNCVVSNFNINDANPYFTFTNPAGTTFGLNLISQYYIQPDAATFSGQAFYVSNPAQSFQVQLGILNSFTSNLSPCFVSYSNEFVTSYANGALNDQVNALSLTSNNFQLTVNTTANSDYSAIILKSSPTIEFGKFIINNDYTNEHTNSGNAWAKHVTTLINFSQLSEDIRVYLTAYQPPNTSFQVFARIQNTSDPEVFNVEDWTRLTQIGGSGLFSSPNQSNNYIELTFGFQNYPNTAFNLAGGTVSTTNNSATVVGTNTTFQSNLAVGNLVRIYDPLFPNNNFIVAEVAAITDNTHLTIDQNILTTINPSLVQNGMLIDKLGFQNQAYNNITNSNVVRYYNTSIVKYDGYNNLQIKVVLLSSAYNSIPQIHSIRAIGVSA